MGLVCLDPDDCEYIGAAPEDAASNVAEISGLVMAHLCCLQFCEPKQTKSDACRCKCDIFMIRKLRHTQRMARGSRQERLRVSLLAFIIFS